MFVFGIFLVWIFLHLDWIRTEYLSAFCPNAGKHGQEKLQIQILFMQWELLPGFVQISFVNYLNIWKNTQPRHYWRKFDKIWKNLPKSSGYWLEFDLIFLIIAWISASIPWTVRDRSAVASLRVTSTYFTHSPWTSVILNKGLHFMQEETLIIYL